MLGPDDFAVTALERAKRSDKQSYLVQLKTAVPDGRVAILRLKLSDTPGLDDPTYELRLRSAVAFAVTGAKCGRGLERDGADGERNGAADLMRCLPAEVAAAEEDDNGSAAKAV